MYWFINSSFFAGSFSWRDCCSSLPSGELAFTVASLCRCANALSLSRLMPKPNNRVFMGPPQMACIIRRLCLDFHYINLCGSGPVTGEGDFGFVGGERRMRM